MSVFFLKYRTYFLPVFSLIFTHIVCYIVHNRNVIPTKKKDEKQKLQNIV